MEKSSNINQIKKLVFSLVVVFILFLVAILFVDKMAEKKAVEYIDESYEKADEFIVDENINIGIEKVKELEKLKERNKILKNDIKRHRVVTHALLVMLIFILIELLYYVKEGIEKHHKSVERMIFVDDVTDGESIKAFCIKIEEFIKNNSPKSYTMVLLNIRNFKLINNSFGFCEGDKTLKYIYKEIEKHLKRDEFMCRSEIDNFFICMKENDEYIIKERLKEIENDINKFNTNKMSKYTIQFAYGLALVEDVNIDYKTIMNYARFSCSHHKKTREFKNYSQIVEELSKENRINSMFEESLKNGEFKVYLQPKINPYDNTCSGAEALVRWIHPIEGIISPGDFINIFEENENIIELDLYVFEEVCKIIRRWIDSNKNIVPISVNLSRKHIKNLNFLEKFIEIKDKYNIPDNTIEFEILESVALDNEKINILSLVADEFHKNGFLCSLDDFGYGYSSLAFFSKLNVDTIKLDRRFFEDLKNERSKNVIHGFIKICDNLNIQVVAEGIETEEQLDYLKNVNCALVQGFVFSRAIEVDSFEKTFLS